MAKFFVTNNTVWYNKLKENMKESPFEIMGDFKCDGIYGLTVKKLQVDSQNILVNEKNVIIQTGTCVYKEEHGEPALKAALCDFDGDVQIHREGYMGNFGCFIKKDDIAVAFNEGAGFYDIFYSQFGKDWIVGTSIIDLAKVLKEKLTINRLNILEELTRYAIFDNDTYFEEVKRLSGDQYLLLKPSKIEVKSLNLHIIQENPSDYDSRAKKIASEMKYIASVMYKNFGQTTLGCTGGFDSRMTLAAYLSAGIKPKIAYGYGNSSLAPSMLGDVNVNQEFSRRYNLEFCLAPWNETEPIDKKWNDYIEKYGKIIYDGCEDAFKFYTDPKEKFLSFGYIGEIYRESDWSKNIEKNKMTLDDYLWGNHAVCNTNIIRQTPRLVEQWLNKWTKLNREHNINEAYFNKRDLFWLILAYRHSADNHMVNLVNQFKYAHYLMSDIRIVRNGYVDFEKKYNGRYMIQILNEVFPDILNVPFFTHCQKMHYNSRKMQIELPTKDYIRVSITHLLPQTIKNKLKKFLGRRNSTPNFSQESLELLQRDGNEEKLRKLIGDDVYKCIEHTTYNLTMVIRGVIICKTFDKIGIKY